MNKRIEKKLVLKKSIRKKINKLLYTIIIFLLGMIATKNILEISYQLKRISKKQKQYLMKDYLIKK